MDEPAVSGYWSHRDLIEQVVRQEGGFVDGTDALAEESEVGDLEISASTDTRATSVGPGGNTLVASAPGLGGQSGPHGLPDECAWEQELLAALMRGHIVRVAAARGFGKTTLLNATVQRV